MNPDIKHAWVAALRSGEFKQGFREYCLDGRFCVLGCLKSIVILSDPVSARGRILFDSLGDVAETIELPINACGKLMDMNDSGKTFAEIADWIEENL